MERGRAPDHRGCWPSTGLVMSGNAAPASSEGPAPPKASSGPPSSAPSSTSSWLAYLWPWGSRQLAESPAGPPTSRQLELKKVPEGSAGSTRPNHVPSESGGSASRGTLSPSSVPIQKAPLSSSTDSIAPAEQGPRGHRCNDRLEDVIQVCIAANSQLSHCLARKTFIRPLY